MDLKTLISKLSPPCRKALESAAQLCVSQTNFNVEVEHFLLKLLEASDTDILRVLRYYDIAVSDVTRELTRAMDKFKRGNSRTPVLSPQVPHLLQEAWVVSSLHLGATVVRSGGIVQALLDNDALRGIILESAPTLLKLPREKMREDMPELIRGSSEDAISGPLPQPGQPAPAGDSKTPSLDQYTQDLTAEARAGKIDPVQGRDFEIRQIIDILMRRRQNNPILTGDAGVGKTAVVEGFALRVAKGDVPPPLQPIAVRMLDLGLLQAGAGVRGEFENRLKSVISEVKASPKPIILFIDEAHTLIGAGAAAGQGDAANLLKPALARGELRTIAATTWSEYKKYFEKDPALARRFQVIQVEEPDEPAAMAMLRSVAPSLEKHHGVRILDEAVHDAVTLSNRYISGRKLPDKAVSVLDTACARVAISQTSMPPEVEAAAREISRIEEEIAILKREESLGREHPDRSQDLQASLQTARAEYKKVNDLWQQEVAVFRKVRELQMRTDAAVTRNAGAEELAAMRAELGKLKDELAGIQKDQPMVPLYVSARVVASVVSGWTGIPAGKMMTDEIRGVLALKERMAERVVGQLPALDAIARRIRTSRAELVDPGKPVGVFLLAGPSGVGKTETAIALAELLFGGEANMVVVNMSEYQEAHSVSGLKGSPPGYVGFGSGGVLTEAVRRDPYTVVLLDEVEKAHPDVMDLFYQVFDKGVLEDAEGLAVNFKNTVILLTSNVGSDRIVNACQDRNKLPDENELVELIRPELLRYFRPAFLGRLVVVPYYPLGDDEIRRIVKLKLAKIEQRFRENHRAELTYDDSLISAIVDRCTEVDSGARNIDHILTHTLLPEISAEILERMAAGTEFHGVHVAIDSNSGSFDYEFR
ncbi:MAG TPA: type VI secretion system ATPase TssH [Terriglobia bacterium]|jgi:type VI secretion system protein VasG